MPFRLQSAKQNKLDSVDQIPRQDLKPKNIFPRWSDSDYFARILQDFRLSSTPL